MSTGIDKLLGTSGFFLGTAIYIYYTIWLLLIPFVDQGHFLHNYFPDWQYAIRVPLIIMIFGLTAIFSFLGAVMIKSKRT